MHISWMVLLRLGLVGASFLCVARVVVCRTRKIFNGDLDLFIAFNYDLAILCTCAHTLIAGYHSISDDIQQMEKYVVR